MCNRNLWGALLTAIVVLLGWSLIAIHAANDNAATHSSEKRCVGIAVSGERDGSFHFVYRAFDDGSVEAARISPNEIHPPAWRPISGR